MDKLVGWLILIAIASSIFVLFYYLLWVKIEVTAKYLVSIMTIIAVVYVGYDLLITVFSYGTWAVFFKKLVGSIIIILPISYMLYWLEKLKIKKLYEQNPTNNLFDRIFGQGKYIKKEDYRKQNGIDHVLSAIKVLNETNVEVLRLEFKNIGEALTALWDKDIKTINIEGVDHFIIDDKVYGMYVSQDRYIDITDFSNEDNIKTLEWMDEQKIIIEKRNAKIMANNTSFLKDDDEIPF